MELQGKDYGCEKPHDICLLGRHWRTAGDDCRLQDHKNQLPPVSHRHAVLEPAQVLLVH